MKTGKDNRLFRAIMKNFALRGSTAKQMIPVIREEGRHVRPRPQFSAS
jgi:hypothetical protein